MERRLWSVLEKRDDFRTVDDGFSVFALIAPPVWALWHGLWVTFLLLLAIGVVNLVLLPEAVGFVAGLAVRLICAFEAGQIRRLEYALRGWRERGLVEAASRDGAEELWIRGQGIRL